VCVVFFCLLGGGGGGGGGGGVQLNIIKVQELRAGKISTVAITTGLDQNR